jgi:hypothetical protein
VAPLWDKWTYNGIKLSQDRTKLRTHDKFAEITGETDCIWEYFLKKKKPSQGGRSKVSKSAIALVEEFDSSKELDIFVVVDDEDYEEGEFHRKLGQAKKECSSVQVGHRSGRNTQQKGKRREQPNNAKRARRLEERRSPSNEPSTIMDGEASLEFF